MVWKQYPKNPITVINIILIVGRVGIWMQSTKNNQEMRSNHNVHDFDENVYEFYCAHHSSMKKIVDVEIVGPGSLSKGHGHFNFNYLRLFRPMISANDIQYMFYEYITNCWEVYPPLRKVIALLQLFTTWIFCWSPRRICANYFFVPHFCCCNSLVGVASLLIN